MYKVKNNLVPPRITDLYQQKEQLYKLCNADINLPWFKSIRYEKWSISYFIPYLRSKLETHEWGNINSKSFIAKIWKKYLERLCLQKSCSSYAKCALKDDGKAECICPALSSCPKDIKAVCGVDGGTYVNDCFRKVASCRLSKVVPLAHSGQCGMCKAKKCSRYSKCFVSKQGEARCKCPDEQTCPQVVNAVCGSDDETYLNECVMKARSCKKNFLIEKKEDQACDVCTFVKTCKNHAKCVANDDKTVKCVCPVKKDCNEPKNTICASNDKTYNNECLMKVDACKKKLPLKKKHDGPCGPCEAKICPNYARCKAEPDDRAVCVCPPKSFCPVHFDPLCGSDGKTYPNACELQAAACRAGKQTVPRHRGKCGVCSTLKCEDYEICNEMNGTAACECPTVDSCPRDVKIVCGSDGKSYLNKCRMKIEACRKKRSIVKNHDGICEPCSISSCRNNGTCSVGDDGSTFCACPDAKSCPKIAKIVCGSNRQTFQNECNLRVTACNLGTPIYVKKDGLCSPCAFANCKENRICSRKSDRTVHCTCPRNCPSARDPVCASNGKTYSTKCHMEKESCEKGKFLVVQKKGTCDACSNMKCRGDSKCVVEGNGKTSCKCQDPRKCPRTVKEICGTDGRTYKNQCLLKAASCKGRKRIRVAKDGPCGLIESFCSLKNCKYGSVCKRGKCACPKVAECPADPRSVCGTDGRTYQNQCHLDVTSCQRQMLLEATKFGECESCSGKKCSNHGKCVALQGKSSKCKCPNLGDCSRKIELLCGKMDRNTYINECAQKVYSCRKQKSPGALLDGYCSVCSLVKCPFNGECNPAENGGVKCSCIKRCPRVKDTVCADDGLTYYSKCVMKKKSCENRKLLKTVHKGACGLRTHYDLQFPGKENDFVELKDIPKLKEVTIAFWIKTRDKTKKGAIFSYSVPGKRNALTLADPSGFVLYINGDEKDGVHKKTGVFVNDDKWNQITLTWQNRDGSWRLFKNGMLAASGRDFQKQVIIPSGGTMILGQLQEDPGYRHESNWSLIGRLSQFNVWSKELPLSQINGLAQSCSKRRGDVVTWCDVKKMVFGDVKVVMPSVCPDNREDPCCRAVCPQYTKCIVNKEGKGVCVCQNLDGCPAEQDLVCASDGKTYGNKCVMKASACMQKKSIEVVANRRCDACVETQCKYHATCEIGVNGSPVCVCPAIKSCPAMIKPVCGSNGKSYINECRLKYDSCKKKKKILVKKEGICDHCMFTSCLFYGTCSVDNLGSTICLCPEEYSCPKGEVCASDGLTYTNECAMKKRACTEKTELVVVHKGACNACTGEKCELFAKCHVVNGAPQCVCPTTDCKSSGPVCGSNNKTYPNRCHLQAEACLTKRDIYVASNGTCDPCSKKVCKFYSKCEIDSDNKPYCVCPRGKCAKSHEPVCGDDGFTYNSHCALKLESCSKKKPIRVKNQGVCGIIEHTCTLKTCKNYAVCEKGKCVCPTKDQCSRSSERVCASDGNMYQNDCHMRVESCRLGKTLVDVGTEKCYSCRFSICPVNGKCTLKKDGTTICKCTDQNSCPKQYNRVCGTNDKTYNNSCHLKVDECRQNKLIGVLKRGSCDEVLKFFRGSSYMLFDTPLRMIGKLTNVEFNIRPVQENGILLYTEGEVDFIAVILNNGRVEFMKNLGDGVATMKTCKKLAMNKWYHVKITRKDATTQMFVNQNDDGQSELHSVSSPQKFDTSNIGTKLYLGGVEDIPPKHFAKNVKTLNIKDGYVGCLKLLKISFVDYDLLYPGAHIIKQRNIVTCRIDPCLTTPCENGGRCKFYPKMGETFLCLCPKGYVGKRCQAKDEPVYFMGSGSYAELPVFRDNAKFAVSMDVRTIIYETIILYGQSTLSRDFVSIGINKDGFVEVSLDAKRGKIKVKSKQAISLLDWHTIKVNRDQKIVDLTVDNQETVRGILPNAFNAEIDLKNSLIIGEPKQLVKKTSARTDSGLTNAFFTGCIRTVVIDEHSINFANDDTLEKKGLSPCKVCQNKPCGDPGKCSPVGDSFICKCDENYSGKFCTYKDQNVYFKEKGSMMILNIEKEYNYFDISFNIRPQVKTGPILMAFKQKDFISIAIRDCYVEARVNPGDADTVAISKDSIDLHKWHKIRVVWNKAEMQLLVDQQDLVTEKSKGSFTKVNLNGIMYIGTIKPESPSSSDLVKVLKNIKLSTNLQFIGCFSNMTLNGKRLDFSYPGDDVQKQILISDCTSCNPTPCKNNGTCIAKPDLTYSCQCPSSFTGSVCEVPGCSVGMLDLAFVLDDSGSVKEDKFSDVIKFVTYMIDAFPGISERGTRVGVVMFADEAKIHIAFNRFYRRELLVDAVTNLKREMGKTFTNKGLEKANELFSPARGSRAGASKVLILMTDGKSKGDVGPPSRKLHEKNVRVIAVGVGKVSPDELEHIARKEENVFIVPTFKGLETVIARLIPASCPRPKIP